MYGSPSIQYLHKSFFNQQQNERPMTYFFRSIVSCLWELLNGIKCVCVFVCFLSFWAAVVVAAVVLLGRIARVNYCLSVHNPERLETGAIWPILWLCAVKSDETNKLPETMAWVSYLGNVPVCYTGNKINPPSQDIYFLSAMTSESEQFLQQKQKKTCTVHSRIRARWLRHGSPTIILWAMLTGSGPEKSSYKHLRVMCWLITKVQREWHTEYDVIRIKNHCYLCKSSQYNVHNRASLLQRQSRSYRWIQSRKHLL